MESSAQTEKKRVYCAVYTRKSTSEGLDQDFTSLDAQREAGLNYIASQKGEGWVALDKQYNDGGFTGANMDRPGLAILLEDIRHRKVDCVVVYKVDRLSRSLLDFTKMLEFFDKNNVTFVSVTQAFNTNNSMGRLTLNILLSFAQFEREIISERTRDKMAASKKKGKWMGGFTPVGYDRDIENKALVINPQEADLIREIFNLYIREKSLLAVGTILNERGLLTKKRTTKNNNYGGNRYKKTDIQKILKNITYTGKVRYQGELYDGLHKPIVSEEIFRKVQEILSRNCIMHVYKHSKNIGLLNHLIRCKSCNATMYFTYAMRGPKKYTYYVCINAQKRGFADCRNPSINARILEDTVIEQVLQIVKDSLENDDAFIESFRKHIAKDIETLRTKLNGSTPGGDAAPEGISETEKIRIQEDLIAKEEIQKVLLILSPILWDSLFLSEKKRILESLIELITYEQNTTSLSVTLSENGLRMLQVLRQEANRAHKSGKNGSIAKSHESRIDLRVRHTARRDPHSRTESNLLLSLLMAYQIKQFIIARSIKSTTELLKWVPFSRSRISQLMHLPLLAPDIQEEIVLNRTGKMTGLFEKMIRKIPREMDWDKQRILWNKLLSSSSLNTRESLPPHTLT